MTDEWKLRLQTLKDMHDHQHRIVEALEAENAPGFTIAEAKKKKLQLKDQIQEIENKFKA